MSRRPARLALLSVVVLAVGVVGCCALGVRLLPERYAINAPIGHLVLGRGTDPASDAELQRRIAVPDGFVISAWASGIANARFLRFTARGDLLVTSPRTGRVLLLARDADGDARSDATETLLDGLDRPHGIDLHDGWLYVGEGSAIARVRFDAEARRTTGDVERIVTGLPDGGNHWTRTVRIGPDGWMYVSVGSSCNVCVEKDDRRAALLRFRPDGSEPSIHATGLRNSVGFDWQPNTSDLYATDNGRDLLGDDLPPCELNRIVEGGFYGWPFAYGDRVPDPDLGAGHEAEIAASIPPAHEFRAHTAPLGITFVRGEQAPDFLRGAALVALHGSWNRTRKDGYEVVSLHWTPDGRVEERPFVTGFQRDERVIGRPVDVAEGPDGAFYVSDDYAGAVYRIAWTGQARVPVAAAVGSTPKHDAGSLAAADPLANLAREERAHGVARGAALYDAHACYRCHEAARADPGTVAVPLAELGRRYDVDGLAAFLAAPQPPMPLVPLTARERRELAIHLLDRH